MSAPVDGGPVVAPPALEPEHVAVLGHRDLVAGEQVHRVGHAAQLEHLDLHLQRLVAVAMEAADGLHAEARELAHLAPGYIEQLTRSHGPPARARSARSRGARTPRRRSRPTRARPPARRARARASAARRARARP